MLAIVPRKKPAAPASPSEPVQINLKMSAELLEAIDGLVEKINRARPWPKMTRSDLIRTVMDRTTREPPDWLLGAPDAELEASPRTRG